MGAGPRRKDRSPEPEAPILEGRVRETGYQGDGLVETDHGPIYVPTTLAGERVRFQKRGKRGNLIAILETSPERTDPFCSHFGSCGGCLLQHMNEATYRTHKRQSVLAALKARNLDPPVSDLIDVPRPSRRRAVLSAQKRRDGTIDVGYRGRNSHDIVPLTSCPILAPALNDRFKTYQGIAAVAVDRRNTLKIHVTETETGADIVLHDARRDEHTRQRLLKLAIDHDVARLGFVDETIVQLREPRLTIGHVSVTPPPGAFLQATVESEQVLGDVVQAALKEAGAKWIADLFCGIGTFSLPLARGARIDGFDQDRAALEAFGQAVRAASGLRPVAIHRRDLFRNPVTARELNRFDAALFDPPRAGAERQAAELAASSLAHVVAVSCNPQSLARDLSILAGAKFSVQAVHLVDQFVFSPHIECVAVCKRERRRG
ncbi:MAG: RNA methyltransferase [Pseudomonadota bacterium]